jgi:intracellular sulfur oxidation DsrE/DsrF family protein
MSTMVTCSPARSRSAAATRMTKIRGNGIAVSMCGQQFDSHRIEDTIIHVPHITARGGYEIRH